ncbi:MAG: ATP-binding cassette domain-containing protein [Acidimicrobiales bacterium]
MVAIEIRNLSRTYERKGKPDIQALKAIDLSIPQGEVHGLLGPNGAGKTTLCKILCTILLPSAGTASVLGHDVVAEAARVKSSLGIVFGGERGLYDRLTARQNLWFWTSLYGLSGATRRTRVAELLERVGLTERADEKVQSLSRGMKQRLHLARGLVSDPGVLILDEPSVGMDPVAAHDFRSLVRDLRADGRTIMLTTHDMAEAAALSDRVSLIDNGNLTVTESPDTIGDLVSSYERLDARGVPPDTRARVAALPGVVAVTTTEDGVLRIETEHAEATRAALLALVEAGVTDVARRRPSLEDVYLHLVGDRGMVITG